MNNKTRKCLDRVTQLDSSKLPMISGRCVINGIERPVAAFEVPKGKGVRTCKGAARTGLYGA